MELIAKLGQWLCLGTLVVAGGATGENYKKTTLAL